MGAYHFAGPDSTDDDEHYERAISESNCIYRLQGDRLSPHEQAWAAVPHLTLLNSSQVLISSHILLKNKWHALYNALYNCLWLHMTKLLFKVVGYIYWQCFFRFRLFCLTSAASSICGMGKTSAPVRGNWPFSWLSRFGTERMTTATAGSTLWIPLVAVPTFPSRFTVMGDSSYIQLQCGPKVH